ncbi:uroporphyrinogen-iii synthase [Ophiostoma piceae UAMH 11346]|uniref:Uroporphyrinogen-iii synthase n=1 Tax=Ophiostoma piceae (strain UAMH 11346) TaxID=1262450 RepID=S3BQP1_OPHP1|nr:uroporphyrinogen-iii synthase [Ophiostoma piceae UAMH 11346]
MRRKPPHRLCPQPTVAMAAPPAPYAARTHPSVPVFLLKTKSSPHDAYEELFSSPRPTSNPSTETLFEPVFVPVLEHRFDDAGVASLTSSLTGKEIAAGQEYGGMIFTSQRAVEAFTKVVHDNRPAGDAAWPHLQVPVYSVGPATTRALKAVPQEPALQVSGEHTGNGEDLAYYIQDTYTALPRPDQNNNKLLFLVGDKRRDIIPKVMASGKARDGSSRTVIPVDEVVVYGTGEMASFGEDFRRLLDETQGRPVRWVVVFSPTGCDSMLRELGKQGSSTSGGIQGKTYVATIGPTTRAYLQDTFGYEPDVCAAEPSPQGILRGITDFMAKLSI